jgi:hypothetical protein
MELAMKRSLIRYRFTTGTVEEWHRDIAGFIAALDNDPDLKGKISYRVMKIRDGNDYYHLAGAADDAAIRTLQQRDFFKRYTEKTRQVAAGHVDVLPLEVIGETAHRS